MTSMTQQAAEIANKIKADLKKLDASRLCLAVAQDVAGRIKQTIRENRVTPPISAATEWKKEHDPNTAPGASVVTLMHTGLMHDSVKAQQSGFNKAQVIVEPKRYGAFARVSSIKTKAERWMKKRKADTAKRKPGSASKPTTEQVAQWHNDGSARHGVKREFFKLPTDFAAIVKVRFEQWIVPAIKRIFPK